MYNDTSLHFYALSSFNTDEFYIQNKMIYFAERDSHIALEIEN